MCPVISYPYSAVEPVTEILHGASVTDPYRWLEDQNSRETRAWLDEQIRFARAYLDGIPGRERIRERVRQMLDVETQDSFVKGRKHYFFRKRLVGQEQPCIYFREGVGGQDQLLLDPTDPGTGIYTAIKPLGVSEDESLLLCEVKQGGERTGTVELFDTVACRRLPDTLPKGYLRGFAFTPDSQSIYYAHQGTSSTRVRAVYHHLLGTEFAQDREVFSAGHDRNLAVALVSGRRQLGFLTYTLLDKTVTSFAMLGMGSTRRPVSVLRNAAYLFWPRFFDARILALTDKDAPNRRIVEVQPTYHGEPYFFTIVPEKDAVVRDWRVTANYILVSYTRGTRTWIEIFDPFGNPAGQIPSSGNDTIRVVANGSADDEILFELESFAKPLETICYEIPSGKSTTWCQRAVPFDSHSCATTEVFFPSGDGIQVPMSLFAQSNIMSGSSTPIVMTSYGGYGTSLIPHFSVLVALLVERGCVFALPHIRGGSEFGATWQKAAQRRNRPVAFDDFLSAARWLVDTGRTTPGKLAIFGGSNAGLLVGVALTRRPDLFQAVLCMVPLLDMLRYHLFDDARFWKDEFGTAEDPDDFAVLARYSPYHVVQESTAYPATMIVSGDADQKCNAFHARKMVARLQAAQTGGAPIFLDYHPHRGHSSVLPLSERIRALTDRVAFFSDQLKLEL
jgi:prolyl oligopeptidase